MSKELNKLKKVCELYKEFEEFLKSLGSDFDIPNGLSIRLDSEKECLYVTENNEEVEWDADEFIGTWLPYIEGAEEAMDHALSDLNCNYLKVIEGKMTENEFIDYAGRLQLGPFKLHNICNKLQNI